MCNLTTPYTKKRDRVRRDKFYETIDKTYTHTPVKYCCRYNAYLTDEQMKLHKCKGRQCKQIKPFEWAEKRNK